VSDFVGGATMAASLVVALIFFGYWRQTHDRLFLMFAAGFAVFAVSRLILAFLEEDDEARVLVYGLRLAAFLLILAAIVNKNRERSPPPADPTGDGRGPPADRPASRPAV
jgi:Family of unknown function (DUF5985)